MNRDLATSKKILRKFTLWVSHPTFHLYQEAIPLSKDRIKQVKCYLLQHKSTQMWHSSQHRRRHIYMISCFSHVWLYNPMDCSPEGSSVHGILQARILEWGAMPFSIKVTYHLLIQKNTRIYPPEVGGTIVHPQFMRGSL